MRNTGKGVNSQTGLILATPPERKDNAMTPTRALAESWASMDGKLDKFLACEKGAEGGYFDGYMAEAQEEIERMRARGFDVTPAGTEG